jgi:hypothetical protein
MQTEAEAHRSEAPSIPEAVGNLMKIFHTPEFQNALHSEAFEKLMRDGGHPPREGK